MINCGLFKRNRQKFISGNNWTRQEYKLGGWNVGEQAQASQLRLGSKVIVQLHRSVCTV